MHTAETGVLIKEPMSFSVKSHKMQGKCKEISYHTDVILPHKPLPPPPTSSCMLCCQPTMFHGEPALKAVTSQSLITLLGRSCTVFILESPFRAVPIRSSCNKCCSSKRGSHETKMVDGRGGGNQICRALRLASSHDVGHLGKVT